MNEPLGIVADLQARREAVVSGLSPAARHQAFPTVYAKPVPRALPSRTDVEVAQKAEIGALKARNAALAAEVAKLRQVSLAPRMASVGPSEPPPVEAVMQAFCAALAKTSYRINGEVLTVNDLRAPTRAQTHAFPRFVAIWLSKRLSYRATNEFIGRQFGRRDYTTIAYAIQHAARVMEKVPSIKWAADEVLETFRAQGATP